MQKLAGWSVLVAAVLVGIPLFFFFGLRDLVPLHHPSPLKLETSQLAGRWVGEGGSELVLRKDGTLTARSSCVGSGSGTWTSTTEPDDAMVDGDAVVEFEIGLGLDEMETGGTSSSPVLWTYVGDPDNGEICEMKKQ